MSQPRGEQAQAGVQGDSGRLTPPMPDKFVDPVSLNWRRGSKVALAHLGRIAPIESGRGRWRHPVSEGEAMSRTACRRRRSAR
jgi:hypothetical protein